ncbi:MAG TPA: L,D-transpeptidase [Aggregatilineales bacterium]|nr:L,D-transpeptidase [Chloroflexota bacterium]HOA25816.1 L,D-transpeptidase [Aggregatilineales bacterium]HPV08574.1 L,D-transpeptidase [Aggregatilineales bacterium]HQE19948.1 L,D-transpeptidase [Aggregatilineales bacterium]
MVSRRAVLKTIGLVGLSAAAARTGLLPARAETSLQFPERWNGEPLARIAQAYQNARAEPHTDAPVVAELLRDEVVRVRRVVRGEQVFWNSDLWLETNRGYLYAAFVQPVRFHLPQKPQADLGEGRWAQLIVPYSDVYKKPDPFDPEAEAGRIYYGGVFRVEELVTGTDGRSWYRIREMYQTIYARATHLRLIPEEELTPLSPDVPPEEKVLRLSLSEQTLIAYEYGEPVWASYVSTGVAHRPTPEGVHYVWDKRISERMVASTASDDPDFYNLPGVPFVCYFAPNWVAIHGTYWHNDYGRPRSSGCVNLTPEGARWVWRWTTPVAPLDRLYYQTRNRLEGTKVIVTA